jgi:hypothetical protein
MPVDIRLAYDDFCLLPSDGKRCAIIKGELLVTPSPNFLHPSVVSNLTYYLSAFMKDLPADRTI